MSAERPPIDTALVRRLVATQFPEWAGLPLRPVLPGGSDHVIHRLGDTMSVRLPRHDGAIGQAEKELRWLPRLAPHLPLDVPAPIAVGRPGLGYPWPWSVSRWLDGEVATVEEFGDSVATAEALAGFVTALQRVPFTMAGHDDRLADRDAETRERIARVAGAFDAAALTAAWDEAVAAPAWDRPPVWYHGDFHTGNLLAVDGRVTTVIDFGGLGHGDPSRDLMMAFTLMSARPRAAFREALGVDDATWARGRGWALTAGLSAYCAYADSNPHVAAATTRQLTFVLEG